MYGQRFPSPLFLFVYKININILDHAVKTASAPYIFYGFEMKKKQKNTKNIEDQLKYTHKTTLE